MSVVAIVELCKR